MVKIKSNIDISLIMTAHDEGILAHPSMQSVFRSVDYAEKKNVTTEIFVVLDNADNNTINYFNRYKDNSLVTCDNVSYKDPGLARNHGLKYCKGNYVAFLDSDDLISKKWLYLAHQKAISLKGKFICYPEYVIFFDKINYINCYKNLENKQSYSLNMIEYNFFNSVHFMSLKSILNDNLFVETPENFGFGFEDWHCYCELISKYYEIKIVKNTCVFYRVKSNRSRMQNQLQKNLTIRPSILFKPSIYEMLQKCFEETNNNEYKI
jgi:glycosyltransferase involved in cell wall biosynthesis